MTGNAEPRLEASLRRAEHLVEAARALAIALEDFEAIALPPASGSAVDQAQLRAIAVLYLASQLETAGVVPAAENLMRLARTGSLPVDLGAATPLLDTFWRSRHERASADERQSFFGGLFGGSEGPDSTGQPRNSEFEDRLIDLCEALYKLDEQASNRSWGGVAQQTRVRSAARQLLDNLARNSSGITLFLAKEILEAVRQALAILNHRAVLAAFGARAVRDVIAAINRRLRRAPSGDFDLYIRRGQAGMTILAWLADAALLLDTSGPPLVGLDHPVIPAAVDWLEASLSLTEAQARRPSDASPEMARAGDSGWATLVG